MGFSLTRKFYLINRFSLKQNVLFELNCLSLIRKVLFYPLRSREVTSSLTELTQIKTTLGLSLPKVKKTLSTI